MRLAILSRNRSLHSIQRLLQEARAARIRCDIINPLDCQLIVDGSYSRILVGMRQVPKYDAIFPRIGASITAYGLAVVKQFELVGAHVVNDARAIAESRDKMRSLQVLTEAGIAVPATALSRNPAGIRMALEAVGGLPVVLKVLQGTQGVGVMLMNAPIALGSVMDTLRGLDQDVLLQKFIAEGAGQDYRAFVIGDRVVAAMMRTAPEGEFRSNIHRGAKGKLVELPPRFEKTAILAARKLNLEVAGVDLMESESGPLVLEVNSSPGFEGIERATGLNVAGEIIKHIQKLVKRKRGTRQASSRSSERPRARV